MNVVEDESEYLQYGQILENEFYEFLLNEAFPSSWITFPTPEKPSSLFKYVSMEFNMSID